MVTINPNIIPKLFVGESGELKVPSELASKVQAGIQARLDQLPPIQQEAFLRQTANLAPGQVDTQQKLDALLDAFAAAAEKLGSSEDLPVFVGDIAKFLGRALIEFAAEQRENALKDRMAARESAKAELMSQAGQMDKAAEKMMTGAITNLVLGVVAGAVSIAGGIAAAVGSASQIGKIAGAATDKAMQAATTKAQVFNAINQATSAAGDATRAGGAGADGITQAEAKKIEAEGSRDAAKAQHDQQTADMKKDIQQQMDEMIKQIINFLKEMREAEVDAMRALTKV